MPVAVERPDPVVIVAPSFDRVVEGHEMQEPSHGGALFVGERGPFCEPHVALFASSGVECEVDGQFRSTLVVRRTSHDQRQVVAVSNGIEE